MKPPPFHCQKSSAFSSQSLLPFSELLGILYVSLHSIHEPLRLIDWLNLVVLSFVLIKQINDLYRLHEMLAIFGIAKIPPTCGIHLTISSNSSFSLFFSPTIAVIPSISWRSSWIWLNKLCDFSYKWNSLQWNYPVHLFLIF